MNLKKYLKDRSLLIHRYLKSYLPAGNERISRAMRYSIFAGGKRLRPILVLEGAKVCGGNIYDAMPAACSLEFIHTYSLIHDDLPAMDNDDLRRGKPTSHKMFDEATAILAGDALLTDAFRLLASNKRNPLVVARIITTVAHAAGYQGMIGGQAQDTFESHRWNIKAKSSAQHALRAIHYRKTAMLIKACLVTGALIAGASKKQLSALEQYGTNIGLAFQICDDILDITADKKILGKRGSDRDNDKLTYPAIYGIEESKRIAQKLIVQAKNALKAFKKNTEFLEDLADYIIERKH